MGDVYAARHLEHGRRVALKLLSQQLRDPEDRQRFLKEGEMAAAINHQHCVYIYGSEEIQGLPVISMELLAGGTLKDRVRQHGPLTPREAVDLILQIIAGLDAAKQRGVLHRDIKPSNCFVDSDGSIKIGDFGLSIPTVPVPSRPHDPTLFHGTPGFAPPEQLRGEPLDVRADIYAVGATLYFLLTGEAPGGRPGLSALAAGLDVKPPKPLTAFRRDVPPPLAAVVGRCLSAHPSSRPKSYDDLTDALTQFSSANTTTATLGLRVAARLFDGLILLPVIALVFGSLVGSGLVRDQLLAFIVGVVIPVWLYWAIAEHFFGFTLGKRACRLSVVSGDGSRPGIARALIRALCWTIPIAVLFTLRVIDASPATSTLTSAALVLAFLLPAVNRREPKLLHDLLTDTRVVMKPRRPHRSHSLVVPQPLPTTEHRQIGPYDIIGAVGATDSGELLLGFDPRLKRHVWIHMFSRGVGAIPPMPHEMNPPTRLRWLNGQRTATANWDAYEAPSGSSILALTAPVPWSALRGWLLDVISDFKTSANHRTATWSLASVWITTDNRAKLLDFSLVDQLPSAIADSPVHFLRLVADHSLGTTAPTALPLSGFRVVRRLRQGDARLDELEALTTGSVDVDDRVTWRQRGMALAAVALTYLIAGGWVGSVVARAISGVVSIESLDQEVLRLGSASACALIALGWAAAWRGGFWLKTFGIAVVTADGMPASRARAALRAGIVWSLVPLAAVAATVGSPMLGGLITIAQLVFAAYATDHPQQGLHDRWAGTFLVPR